MTPRELELRAKRAFTRIMSLNAPEVVKHAKSNARAYDEWFLNYREAATEWAECFTPLRRFPPPPPAKDKATALRAFTDCVCGNRYETFAAVTLDCVRFGVLDAALRRVADLSPRSRDLQQAAVCVWVTVPLYYASAAILSKALRVLMPPYKGSGPLTIYRGELATNHKKGRYRCSWTLQPGIARKYANHHSWMQENGYDVGLVETVVVQATAPAPAIICALDGPEREVLVDPSLLQDVRVLELSA